MSEMKKMSKDGPFTVVNADATPFCSVERVNRKTLKNGKPEKDFYPHLADGSGGFAEKAGLHGKRIPLYHLDELVNAPRNRVHIAEGFYKADLIRATLSEPATAIAGGSCVMMKAPTNDEIALLTSFAEVVIHSDSDGQGLDAAHQLARKLAAADMACIVKVVNYYPDREATLDVEDFLDAGGTIEELFNRIEAAPQVYARDNGTQVQPVKAQAAEMDAVWPELTAPDIPKPSAPMLPCELLPTTLAPWIIDEAERMNVPLEAIAIPAMIGLGSVLGSGVAIQPSWGNVGYLALASNWGTVIAPPGSTKTPAMNAALAPLYELQRKAREQYRSESAAMEAKRKNLESDLEQLRVQLRDALRRKNAPNAPSLTAAIRTKEAELDLLSVDERVYLLNDATIEALGVICAQNPGGILLGSDEIVRPFKSWEKPGHEDDRAFMLSGWQGMMPYDGRRISRQVPYIERFSIAIYGGAQPGVMRDYIEAAQGANAGNDGLVQRLQLAVWPDMLPDFDEKAEENVKRDPDYEARKKAFVIFERLAHFDPLKYGARLVNGIPVFRFAPDAQELFGDFRRELEHRVRKDDELLGNEPLANHFTKYRATMPGLALAAHLASEADADDYGNRVSLHAAQIGKAWCTFLEAHARKLYAGGSGEVAYNPSERLCEAIEDGKIVDGMALRELYRRHWRGLDTLDRLKAALAPLATANWVRIESQQTTGRPGEALRLHPKLRGG
jgi:hypothetical protein